MRSRDSLPIVGLLVGGLIAVLVACGVPGDNPLGPTSNVIGPSSVPHGPSSGPYGPSSKPYGPSSKPYGPSAKPSSAPGGGGGGPQPPTPVPTPTPTPVPSATPPGGDSCPATFTARNDNQFVTNGGGNGPEIVLSGFDPDCIVTGVRVSLYATSATDLSVHQDPVVGFFLLGREIGFDLIEPVAQGFSLSGAGLGSACADLTFADNATAFPNNPPYVGTFRPRGDTSQGTQGTFDVFYGELVNGTWELPFYRLDEAITVHCWRIEFDLDRQAP